MNKRKIVLDIGFSPGDIIVFTAALRDLCNQYPEHDISVATCCPAIFENNPHLINKADKKNIKVDVNQNILKLGYDVSDLPNSQKIYKELMSKNELSIDRVGHKYKYIHKETGLLLFEMDIDSKKELDSEYYNIQYEDIHNAGWSGRHFSQAFYIELEKKLGLKIKQTSLLPDIHLSDEEKTWINQVEQETGYKGKFWLFNCGVKSDYPNKQWPLEYWQQLINLLKDVVQFVQVGEKSPGHSHTPLNGAINFVGKTDLRQLIRLSYHAEGGISHVSLLHHLMAAWQKPAVTIAGGREPRRWESYPHVRYMDTNGLTSCGSYDGCWMDGRINDAGENKFCTNLVGKYQRCMSMIKPEMVAQEIINLENNSMPLHAKLNLEIKELKLKNKTESDKSKVEINKAIIENLEKKRDAI